MFQYLFIECITLVLYIIFGLAIMPAPLLYEKNGQIDEASILIAPIIGSAAWQAINIFFGFLIPYNKILILILFLIAIGIVIYRRKKLYIPSDKSIIIFIIASILISLLVLWGVLPREIDEGLYFTNSAFDHQRTALINSISATGIPPLNPYISPYGETQPMYYHFGWQAIAAQYKIILGVSGLTAGAAANALAYIMTVMAMAYIAYKITNNKKSFLFVLIFAATGSAYVDVKALLLQTPSNLPFLLDEIGFWSFTNDIIWAPHTTYSAAITILIIWFYTIYLKCDKKSEIIHMSIILSMMAASATTSSVYAGGFALIIFILSMIPRYIYDKTFRNSFNKLFLYQVLCVVLSGLLCLKYFLLIINGINSSPIAFGIISSYKITGFFDIIKSILHFYLLILPINVGVTYLLGTIATFLCKEKNNKDFSIIIKFYVAIVLISIFFIHSTVSSNDFAWRTFKPISLFTIIYSAVLFCNLIEIVQAKFKTKIYYILIILACIMPLIFLSDYKNQTTVCDSGTGAHKILNKAKGGWDVIRENTTYSDLVTCNPEGFSVVYNRLDLPTNFLFGFYADRLNCIADNFYVKTSARPKISEEEIDKMYLFVTDFFKGNPSIEQVNYMASTLNVKALLVTSMDGLWDNIGALKEIYKKEIEGDKYKVYIKEENTMNDGKLKMEYLGHGSLKLFLPTGEVCYIDPYAGNDYKESADLILVTHQHSDHNQLSLVKQKEGCVIFQNYDAIQPDGYNEVEYYGMKIEPVQAYNKNHPINECVGYVLRVGGKVIYVAGDTSKTEQMKDLASYNIDYAFLPMDGRFNMDIAEAKECENLIKAKHTIPYHLAPGELFDEERAKEFDTPSALIMRPGEVLELK